MNISEIFKDAFKFPVSNWKRFLILGIIILASTLCSVANVYFGFKLYTFLLILPMYLLIILYRGYFLRVIKVSINEDNELPAFNKLGKMLIDGLKVFVVNIIYFIIPSIVLMVGVFLTFDISGKKFLFDNLNPVAIVVLLIGLLLYAIFLFFYEIGLANMAYHGKLDAALSFGEIKSIIRKIGWKKYLALFVIIIVLGTISGFIGTFLKQISIIGVIIVGLLIIPYFDLIGPRILGLIYREAL